MDRRTDRQTGMTKLKVVFHNFAKAHYNGKSIPLQAWTGPDDSRSLRLPDFKKIGTWRWQGCQPYASAAFTPEEIVLFLLSVRCWFEPRATILLIQNSNDTIGNWTCDLPAWRSVPRPTVTTTHSVFAFSEVADVRFNKDYSYTSNLPMSMNGPI